MTPSELESIEARANAATSGPWSAEDAGAGVVVAFDSSGSPGVLAPQGRMEHAANDASDFGFIAAARSDVPALIAEVRRLTSERDEWKRLAELREEAHTLGYREGRAMAGVENSELSDKLKHAAAATEAGRRAPVQGEYKRGGQAPGTVAWSEHVEAWNEYARRYGRGQSPERIAERAGFGYLEIAEYLGHKPTTWRPIK